MVEIVAIGVGVWLLSRDGTSRKAVTPNPNGGAVETREATKDELSAKGLKTESHLGPLSLAPSGDKAIEIGMMTAKVAASVGGAGLAIATAAGVVTASTGPLGLAVAGGAAAVGAGAATGYLVTQDNFGAISGALVGPGTVFNVGRVLGREIDKMFGGVGDNKEGSSVVSQVVWGVVLAVGYTLGAAASVALFPLAFIANGIASLVSDETRKARGQAGAREDLAKEFDRVFFAAMSRASLHFHEKHGRVETKAELVDLRANAAILALGYALKLNDIHKQQWVARPHGLGVDDYWHYEYGKARDYWVEDENEIRNYAGIQANLEGDSATGRKAMDAVFARSPDAARRTLEQGYWMANTEAYLAWMQSGWGVGQTAESHARWGYEKVKAFECNEISDRGNIKFKMIWVYWEETQRNGFLVVTGLLGGY